MTEALATSSRLRCDHVTALLWTAFVFLALLLPGDSMQAFEGSWEWPTGTDKVVHTALFFFETVGLGRSFSSLPACRRWPLTTAVAVAVLLAIGTEAAQIGVPGRSGNLADLAANAAGILLAAIYLGARRRASRRPR